jgi:hypothetical protein
MVVVKDELQAAGTQYLLGVCQLKDIKQEKINVLIT